MGSGTRSGNSAPWTAIGATARRWPTRGCLGRRGSRSARLNYAQNALSRRGPAPAVVAVREDGAVAVVSWDELRRQVAKAAAGLRALGVGVGDRVAAVLPNTVHSVVAMLATATIGAVWTSCSPDFGPTGLADRFTQVEPTVLIGVDGYSYGGQPYDALGTLASLASRLPGLRATVVVPYLSSDAGDRAATAGLPGLMSWDELMASDATEPEFEKLPFDAPLWILYLVRHLGAAKADRAGPRRHPARAPQGAGAAPRPRPGRPVLLVHHHRLDDVELPRLRPAGRRYHGLVRR